MTVDTDQHSHLFVDFVFLSTWQIEIYNEQWKRSVDSHINIIQVFHYSLNAYVCNLIYHQLKGSIFPGVCSNPI